MAAKSFIRNLAGRLTNTAAIVVSTGAPNDGDLVALDAAGKLDVSVIPAGVGLNTTSQTATEAIAAVDLVNLHAGGIRKADATVAGKEADGFVIAAVANAATGTVYLSGNKLTTTGLTKGARYYLSTTPGGLTTTAPSAAGNVSMYVGTATSTTELMFEPGDPVTM